MTGFQIIALLLTLTALFSYVTYRYLKLPTTIGVMIIALVVSLGLIGLGRWGTDIAQTAGKIVEGIQFDETLMQGLLSFLLFAGALHININDLAEQKVAILVLATFGVLFSSIVMGSGLYLSLQALGLPLSFPFCLLFGALISPTDPIAVLAILKTIKVPRSLEIKIAGESLFNDGVGVIVFVMLSQLALKGGHISIERIGLLFLQEAIGGAVFGLAIGWITYLLLKSVDNYQVEVLLTLALVSGGYALASALHTSGPIAIVVSGLLIGNHGRRFAMSERTRHNLDVFWELLDGILNAVLFVLIGLEVLLLKFTGSLLMAGLIAIPILLLSRWVSVAAPISLMRFWRKFSPGAVSIMTWGGLRGGISVALALSIPPGNERESLVAITYLVVIFSILVQGLTVQSLIGRFYPAPSSSPGSRE
jgi:CPA1 family monovalent cation:H+ antiporter